MRSGLERSRSLAFACALAASLGTSAPGHSEESSGEAWRTLAELRTALAGAGRVSAPFRQSYLPAGFTTGDEERGRVALDLPDCMRWDYLEPYPKSYLLCGDRLHAWVAGEPQGERLRVEARDEAGLDLLLLPVERLAERYRAHLGAAGDGKVALELVPTDPASKIAEASLEFDRRSGRPTALAYRDRDGNLQRFTFESFAPVDDPQLFVPPANLVWQER